MDIIGKCRVMGCLHFMTRQGFCDKHYRQKLKQGEISRIRPKLNKGSSRHPLYNCWASMKNRCYNSKDVRNYKWYGERGIKVCERWLGDNGFWNFVEDMGPRPNGYSIDRINVDGDYCPENCRWVDAQTQSFNRRNSIRIKGHTTQELAALTGVCEEQIRNRVRQGWGDERIMMHKGTLQGIRIRRVEDGKVYPSIESAARENHICSQSISSCAHHKPNHKTAAGYHWEFV